jgi:hypothetical protein
MRKWILVAGLVVCAFAPAPAHAQAVPAPSGPHPRLFLSGEILTGASANAQIEGTAAYSLVQRCQETIDNPEYYMERGGADGDNWPGAAVACAFAWQVTQQQEYLDSAIQYWNIALNDDQTIGDGLGCVVGADAETATTTVRHDTGYPIRWYGPYMALVYDWLHDAPGVDAALLEHSRYCFKAWIDYYTEEGYLHDVAGSNYGAGYVAAKTLIAVAEAGEDGATSDAYWTGAIDDVFGALLVGEGLAGSIDPVGSPAGVLVGGDWIEGWQYGPLSVLEYAFSARALIENGVPLPEMETWAGEIVLNQIYALTPARDGVYSHGDLESDVIHPAPSGRVLRAVYGGTRNEEALGYARFLADSLDLGGGNHPLEAIAEVLGAAATPVDFNAQERPLFRLTRGTRTVYARSSWETDAFWAVFSSAPHLVPDHDHVDAGNFVLSRGADHLIVDAAGYGSRSTLPSNAPTVKADTVQGEYKPSQTAWSEAELLWARGSESGVVAARGDYAKAFNFADTASDIPYALRDWVFLPEGEVVILDRVRSNNETETTLLNFHTPTELTADGAVASATVGSSTVAIHTVALSSGTPSVHAVEVNEDCYDGSCVGGRFATHAYSVEIAGPNALGIHVLDALASDETPADVASINDPGYDPDGDNAGVLGAAVFRSSKQNYVVASSAQDGAAGDTLSYSVPGTNAARHVVFDAPEDAAGKSDVTATAVADRCAISITAGSTFTGQPLMFQVSSAADGCAVTEDLQVAPTDAPAGSSTVEPPAIGGASNGGSTGSNGGAGPTAAGSGAPNGSASAPAAGDEAGCGCRVMGCNRLPNHPLAMIGFVIGLCCSLLKRRTV